MPLSSYTDAQLTAKRADLIDTLDELYSRIEAAETTIAESPPLTVSTANVAFTDGDTARRVTIADAAVTATSKIVCTVRRPDTAADSDDRGYLYIANVVRVGTDSFDLLIVALDLSGLDPTLNPPNETVVLTYTIG